MVTVGSRRTILGTVIALSSTLASGCTAQRAYPVCYYADQPTEEEKVTLRQGWERVVRAYLGSDADVTFSVDDRWVITDGYKRQHQELGKVWPRVGCVGRYSSGLSYPYYSHCLDLLSVMVESQDYLTRGKRSDFLDDYLGYCNGSLSSSLIDSDPALQRKLGSAFE